MIDFDVCIVGSGSAGLICALILAKAGKRVLVCTKDAVTESSSAWAQGGIAVALGKEDSLEQHLADTLAVGCGLNDAAIALHYLSRVEAVVDLLAKWGIPFRKNPADLGLEGGHSQRRIVKIGTGFSGRTLMKQLWELALREANISVSQGTGLIGLEADSQGACQLGIFQDINFNVFPIKASAWVIASGGYSSLFARSSNPPVSTGEPLACAQDLGAELAGLEFVQFHPTVLACPSPFLLSETLRGEGAVLLDAAGVRYLESCAGQELASRAIVALETEQAIERTGGAYLDLRRIDSERFSAGDLLHFGYELKARGFDPSCDLLPVQPAAHYCIGGIKVNESCQSSVAGLWSIGEAAFTGLHGADRLASNSLAECLVSAQLAAQSILGCAHYPAHPSTYSPQTQTFSGNLADLEETRKDLQNLLWEKCGIVRQQSELDQASNWVADKLASLEQRYSEEPSLNSLVLQLKLARQMITSAKARKVSIGTHQILG